MFYLKALNRLEWLPSTYIASPTEGSFFEEGKYPWSVLNYAPLGHGGVGTTAIIKVYFCIAPKKVQANKGVASLLINKVITKFFLFYP